MIKPSARSRHLLANLLSASNVNSRSYAMKRLLVAILAIAPVSTYAQSVPNTPANEQRLGDTFSKYNQLDAAAPNSIQEAKIPPEFDKAFCSIIPKTEVTGWVGTITDLMAAPNGNGVVLMIQILPDIYSGSFGVELTMGNEDAYGVSEDTQPYSPIEIAKTSLLYNSVSNMREGDTVVFGGSFIPFKSPTSCAHAIGYSTYFSLFRFSSIVDIGSSSN